MTRVEMTPAEFRNYANLELQDLTKRIIRFLHSEDCFIDCVESKYSTINTFQKEISVAEIKRLFENASLRENPKLIQSTDKLIIDWKNGSARYKLIMNACWINPGGNKMTFTLQEQVKKFAK